MQTTLPRMTARSFFVAALCFIAVAAFQTGLYAYMLSLFSGDLAQALYYGFWAACGLCSVVCLARTPSLLKMLAPVLGTLLVIVLLTLMHQPFGVVSRSLVVSCYAVGTLSVLFGGLPTKSVLRVSAFVAALTAVSFMAEMYSPGLFSTTEGRSAGLYVNPNVAAGALILGGSAVMPFVPRKWAVAYGVLLFFGVAATVSRTGLLVLAVASGVTAAAWYFRTRPTKLTLNPEALVRGGATLVFCVTSIFAAWQFSPAVRLAAEQSAETVMAVGDPLAAIFAEGLGAEATSPGDAVDAAEALGQSNSGAARVVLMANGLHSSTAWGVGAEAAHALAPHNQYLFFGIAFGVAGWVAAVLLALSVFWACRSNLLFVFCFAGILMFSHDFSVLALAVPVGIGVGGGALLRRSSVRGRVDAVAAASR